MSRNHKHRKTIKKLKAYGLKRKFVWCDVCDRDHVIPEPLKKRERQKAKKQIKKEQNED